MAKTSKLAISLAVACLMVAFVSLTAQADQISIGASSQNVTLVGASGGTLDVTLGLCAGSTNTTCTLSGTATYPNSSTTPYTLTEDYAGTGSSPIVAGPGSSGVYPLALNGATTWVQFGASAPVQINYLTLDDGSANPHFDGWWLVSGQKFNFDYTLQNISGDCNSNNCTVDYVAANGGTIANPISSGEFDTPEPASLGLFGLGLFGLAFVYRRRMKAIA